MNLPNAFASVAKEHLAKTAVFWGEHEYRYSELLQQAQGVAEVLRCTYGVRAGDRVGIWLKNRPEFVPALFGILFADAVVVPINNFLKPDEVNYIIMDAGIDVLITEDELAAHSSAITAARPKLQLWTVEQFPAEVVSTRGERLSARAENDLAVLIYTSGTTGKPKGAMLSHGNLLHNVESCRIVLQTVEGDRIAVLLPMFHSYMLTVGILLPLLVGGSIILVKSVHPLRNAFQELIHRQTTVLPGIPQFYRSMVHVPAAGPLPFRLFISGAAPLPKQVLLEFEAKFKAPLIEGYGLSEASPVVTKNPLDGRRKPGSIGIPITNVEVSIQDDSGRELGPGQIGELCVRGGNVMLGYWNNPEETSKVMRDGWLLTGDVGYRDEEGFYFITDRKKDMLLVNGINVYPREIEEVLYGFPGIKEAAVIGKEDVRKGEQPVAFIAPVDGQSLSEESIRGYLRGKLADYKVPRRIVVVPALPRNATGKILKTRLREIPLPE